MHAAALKNPIQLKTGERVGGGEKMWKFFDFNGLLTSPFFAYYYYTIHRAEFYDVFPSNAALSED